MKKAFSLMELMIVIIILGLLASLIMPNIIGQSEDAKRKITCIAMKNLAQTLELFKQDNGAYPSTEEGLKTLSQNPDPEKYTSYLQGGYINTKNLPKDPWKNPFIYINNEGSFDLISLGSDKKEGGSKDASDISYSNCQKI